MGGLQIQRLRYLDSLPDYAAYAYYHEYEQHIPIHTSYFDSIYSPYILRKVTAQFCQKVASYPELANMFRPCFIGYCNSPHHVPPSSLIERGAPGVFTCPL